MAGAWSARTEGSRRFVTDRGGYGQERIQGHGRRRRRGRRCRADKCESGQRKLRVGGKEEEEEEGGDAEEVEVDAGGKG